MHGLFIDTEECGKNSSYMYLLIPSVLVYIFHIGGGGIYINSKKVGTNFTISSGCVLGSKGSNENIPEVGDNVELCIGGKIIGKVKIGNNVIIAPNSVVIKDIPHNAVVSGVPAKVIKINE